METMVVDIQDPEFRLEELVGQVEHGISFILNRGEKAVARILPAGQRVPGLNAGSISVADDFDDPLPDGFWMGEG